MKYIETFVIIKQINRNDSFYRYRHLFKNKLMVFYHNINETIYHKDASYKGHKIAHFIFLDKFFKSERGDIDLETNTIVFRDYDYTIITIEQIKSVFNYQEIEVNNGQTMGRT